MSDFLQQMKSALGVPGRYITVIRPIADYSAELIQERLIPNLGAPKPMLGDGHWKFASSTAYLEIEPGWYAALSFIEDRWEDHNSPCHCASDGTLLRADEFSSYWQTANIWTTLDIPVVADMQCDEVEEDDEQDWNDDDDDDYSDEPDDEDPF